MKFEIKNWNWEVVNSIELSDEIFSAEVRDDIIARVVRWQRAKSRSGNASTKTRSDVSGTTRKPWAQKETGRARQGSLRSPHFRGGGVVFGPHPRSYEHSLTKKIRRNGAISILSSKMEDKGIHLLDNIQVPYSKTKDFIKWKEERNFKSILFVVGNDLELNGFNNSFSNVPYCDFMPVRGFNVLDCIKHENIIFDVNSIEQLIDRYSTKFVVSQENGEEAL